MPPSKSKKQTIRQSLGMLGIQEASAFESCGSERGDEFKVVRKIYLQVVLKAHPDKGGDPDAFREIQTSFEMLRDLHAGKRGGAWLFSECLVGDSSAESSSDSYNMGEYDTAFNNMETPSWDYYAEAADAEVPIYRVEPAKSGRSMCKQKGKTSKKCSELPPHVDPETCEALAKRQVPEIIEKGEIRVGSWMEDTGTYTRWVHLRCWRVPHRVWLGIPDPETVKDEHQFMAALTRMNDVLLSGFTELSPEAQTRFVRHAMDKSHWARASANKKQSSSTEVNTGGAPSTETKDEDDEKKPAATKSSTALAKTKQAFVVPVPGRNGCLANVLQDKRVVLTGTFPELGGGGGLSLGKGRAKALVESFGGRVTGSISGKTDVLLVGKSPGFSKVSQARSKNIQLISLHDFKVALESGAASLDDFEEKPMLVQDFSAGYKSNGLALKAAPEDLRLAQGLTTGSAKRPVLAIEDSEEADSKLPARKKIRSPAAGATKGQDDGDLAVSAAAPTADKENKLPDKVAVVKKAGKKPGTKAGKPKKTVKENKLPEGAEKKGSAETSKALVVIGDETAHSKPSARMGTRRSTRLQKIQQGND